MPVILEERVTVERADASDDQLGLLQWCESWAWADSHEASDGCAREGALLAELLGEPDRACALWARVTEIERMQICVG